MPANQYACILCLSLLSTCNMWAACTSIYMYWKTYSYTDQSSKLFVCINEFTVVLIDFRFIHKARSNKTILKLESLHVVWLHHQLFCSTNLLYIERCFYLQSWMMAKKDIEIQPGFESGSSEFRSFSGHFPVLCMIAEFSTPSLREIQPENRTVSMDKCHLSSAPMPELQWLSW